MSAIPLVFGESLDISTVAALSVQEVNNLLRVIDAEPLQENWIRERALFHKYEGLDVTYIRRHWSHLSKSGLYSPAAGVAAKVWTAAELAQNVRETIVIGLVYGNVTDNNFHKRSEDAQNFVNDHLQRCKLVQNVTPLTKRTAVTINRTMIAFAIQTVLISRYLGRDYNEGPATGLLRGLPNYMKTTVFPSVLPDFVNTEIGVFICRVFTIWSANMNLVINRRGPTRRKRNFSDDEFLVSYQTQSEFSEIAYGSDAFEQPRAKDWLKGQNFNSPDMFNIMLAIYDEEKGRLGLPDVGFTAAEWAAGWI